MATGEINDRQPSACEACVFREIHPLIVRPAMSDYARHSGEDITLGPIVAAEVHPPYDSTHRPFPFVCFP
jgi:hypothetical protein